MLDIYKTIKKESQGFYSEKGSKFISFAFPVSNEKEIKEFQQQLRKKYYDARHHVYAFILGVDKNAYRASDDGEPANSSGMPVLGQLRSHDLTNVVIIVVRYFGGTKLGVPGLINAYRSAAQDAIANAQIIEETVDSEFSVFFSYDEMSYVMRVLKDFDANIIVQEFVEQCKIIFAIRNSFSENIINSLKKNHKVKISKNDG